MADTIKIGNLDISSFKVGASDCSIYLGDTKLYPLSPSFGDKAILHLSNGTEVNIPQTAATDTTLSYSDVSGYSVVKYVELTDNTQAISDGTFAGMTLQYIRTDVSTPPTIGTALDGTYPIFVPNINLSTYQSSWNSISSRIKAYDDYYTLSLTDIDLLGYSYINSNGIYEWYGDTTVYLSLFDNYKIGSIVTTVNMMSYTYGGSSSQPLEVFFPSTVTNLTMYRQYTNYLNMICLATTPPTMSRQPQNFGRWNFYVPDEAVSAYQSSWSNFGSYIHPISEWTGDTSYFG